MTVAEVTMAETTTTTTTKTKTTTITFALQPIAYNLQLQPTTQWNLKLMASQTEGSPSDFRAPRGLPRRGVGKARGFWGSGCVPEMQSLEENVRRRAWRVGHTMTKSRHKFGRILEAVEDRLQGLVRLVCGAPRLHKGTSGFVWLHGSNCGAFSRSRSRLSKRQIKVFKS